jgi:hypothetical protein
MPKAPAPGMEAAVYRGITRQSPATEQRRPAWRIAEIERRGVDPGAGAAAVGVTRRTWNRWKSGQSRPSAAHAERLSLLTRRVRLPAGRERRLRTKEPSVIIRATFRYSKDVRQRTVDVGPYVDMDRVVDAYLAGDDAGAAGAIDEAIDEYVAGMDVTGVETIYFGL